MSTPVPPPMRALSAAELRKIAEAADGQRGKDLQLMEMSTPAASIGNSPVTVDNTKYMVVDPFAHRPVGSPRTVWTPILNVRTEFENPDRDGVIVEPTQLILPNGKKIPLDCPKYDAIFWSESSIEKFFFPYYVHVLSPMEFARLYSAYYFGHGAATVYGFIHYPPTDYDFVESDGTVKVISIEGLKTVSEFIVFLDSQAT